MSFHRRRFLHLTAGAAALPALSHLASAQAYPSRPIAMNVPYAAGGPTDVIGRIVAERMRASLGQTIVIDNVGGASGSIGVGRLARTTPDGYTFGIGNWATHVLNGPGAGSSPHIAGLFSRSKLTHIFNSSLIAALARRCRTC
jgi:tripartite-type tricarboxylate transporter receptor subunit TctC